MDKNKGFALLLAVVIATAIISVGTTIYVVANKELSTSITSRDSQVALYAAESGKDCAKYWLEIDGDGYFSAESFGGTPSYDQLNCNGVTASISMTNTADPLINIFEFEFGDPADLFFSKVYVTEQRGDILVGDMYRIMIINAEGFNREAGEMQIQRDADTETLQILMFTSAWRVTPWSACSAPCWIGPPHPFPFRTRTVTCIREDTGDPIDPAFCSHLPEPHDREDCNEHLCTDPNPTCAIDLPAPSCGPAACSSRPVGISCTCNSCDSCQLRLSDPGCDTVRLTSNINNHLGTCILNPSMNGKTFDCQNRTIDGVGIGYGIAFQTSGNATRDDYAIQNCNITEFQTGIMLNDGNVGQESENALIKNNTITDSSMQGIVMDRHTDAELCNNVVSNSGSVGIAGTNVRNSDFICNFIDNSDAAGISIGGEDDTNDGPWDNANNNNFDRNSFYCNDIGLLIRGGAFHARNNDVDWNTMCFNVVSDLENNDANNSGDNNKGDIGTGNPGWIDDSVGLPDRFTFPCPPPASYSWHNTPFAGCTATCMTSGIETRSIWCERDGSPGVHVPDSNCDPSTRPTPESRSCPQLDCCGNGVVEGTEDCDDGCLLGIPNVCEPGIDDQDTCSYTCRNLPIGLACSNHCVSTFSVSCHLPDIPPINPLCPTVYPPLNTADPVFRCIRDSSHPTIPNPPTAICGAAGWGTCVHISLQDSTKCECRNRNDGNIWCGDAGTVWPAQYCCVPGP